MKIDEVFLLCLFEESEKFRVVTTSLNMTEAIVGKLNKSLRYGGASDSEREQIHKNDITMYIKYSLFNYCESRRICELNFKILMLRMVWDVFRMYPLKFMSFEIILVFFAFTLKMIFKVDSKR